MTKAGFVFFIGCLLVVAFTGCYRDKADMAYPRPVCDTTNITYTVEITAIMQANCYSCHSGTADLGSGIQLDDYATLKSYALSGILFSSITHDGKASAMPKGAAKLSNCDIDKFDAWIKRGAQPD